MGKTRVIAFSNNKGGSGKSTVCGNLGYALSGLGRKVLLVDGDMQMNLSLTFFDEERVMETAQKGMTLYECLLARRDLAGAVVHTPYENLDLVPSTILMSQLETDLFPMMQRELVLRKCLAPVRDSGFYDYILIDAPPNLGIWVINILCACDRVIIPMEASPWGLYGLANMMEFMGKLEDIARPELLGILITKVNERKNYYRQTRRDLSELEHMRTFDTVIHVDANIEWAQEASRPVEAFKKSTRSALEFSDLAKEVEGSWQ